MMANDLTETEIRLKLSRYQPEKPAVPENFKAASVLIPFYPQPEGLALVFMKRPDNQGPHGGQISFPGGSKEVSDPTNLRAALRETEEEFGIDRDAIEVWGRLKPQFTTVSRFWVTPFVGKIPYPGHFKPSKEEVERLLVIPFSHLTDPGYFSVDTYHWQGFDVPSYLYQFNRDVIWGLTARILFNLITLLNTGKESDSRWPAS
jgi:8-oxo-dGTP pyrophosphatase MutT (NUDIX family)